MRVGLCAGVFALVSIGSAADVRVVEEIVAKVNGDIITKGEIERSRQQIETELKQQGVNGAALEKTVKERAKDALRDQIDQLLLVQHGKDLNINVDGEVTKRIAAIQLDSKIADPDKFHDYIREQTQMPFEDFRQKIRDQILTQRVIGQEVGSKINVPHVEIEKYYEEHKKEFVREEQVFLSEILISTEGKTPEQTAQAEKRAKDLVARLRKGEKFSELARQYSDAETKDNFGQLPPYKRGQLRKEIEEIVFKEKKGYITEPIKMPNGFEILKIEERYEAGIALEGWEVKAIRGGRATIGEAYVMVRGEEIYLIGANISPLPTVSTHFTPDPRRTRKLLLRAEEIRRLIGKVEQRGYTLVPLNLHYSKGRIKLEVGLGRGKLKHDKRAAEREKEWNREKQRLLRHR